MSEYMITASGVSYHRTEVLSIGRRKRDYWDMTDAQLAEKYPEDKKRIYAYSFPSVTCELVPEPDNPTDPSAIKIIVDGQHVGYVPASECYAVRSILGRAEAIHATVGKGPCKLVDHGDVRHFDDPFEVRVTITYSGAPVSSTRSPAVRSGKANRSVILQWIAAGLLLIFGLSTFPSFSPVFFILAAVLAAPIRPLRDLLAARGIRGWMIAAAAVVFTVLGFVVYPGR